MSTVLSPIPGKHGLGPAVRDASEKAYIVAHKENIHPLIHALHEEGFSVEVIQGPYSQKQWQFSASMRCMVNHANAWKAIVTAGKPGLVVEADFVPVRGLGNLPLPCPPGRIDDSLIYLYACGPQFWELVNDHIARGHAGGMVASVICPKVAWMLLQYLEEELSRNHEGRYTPWDAGLGYWLKERGIESYIPYRHYGEHGGIWNPEHRQIGLHRPHRADVLQGDLAFLPLYSKGSHLRLWAVRCVAYLKGWARLLSGRMSRFRDAWLMGFNFLIPFLVGRLVLPTTPGLRRFHSQQLRSQQMH